MEKDFEYYKNLIEQDQLPDGFDQWLMNDENGWTLAHIAACHGNLPPDWTDNPKDWLVKDRWGNTVAHDSTRSEILPKNWTDKPADWLMKDDDGITVAHLAVLIGILPPGWTDKTEDWLVKNDYDYTVASYAASKGTLPPDWTDDPNDWKIQDNDGYTIGFFYSLNHQQHYNNPQSIEEYCQNMKDHLFPIVEKSLIQHYQINHFHHFLEPFISCIKGQTQDSWMKTSDTYSGFLIDYTESVVSYIQDNLRFVDFIEGDDLILANKIKDNLEQTSQHLQNEKIKIKEHLFLHYESKNKSIIKDNKEPDFSSTI